MSLPALDLSLTPFFTPSGVAVVGASLDPTKLGYSLARNLVQSNFRGAVHFINPRGGSLFGMPVYPNILQVPDPLDLAFLMIPARSVPQAIDECGQRGLKAVIIGSGGFRETGAQGAELEELCVTLARWLPDALDRPKLHRSARYPPSHGCHLSCPRPVPFRAM